MRDYKFRARDIDTDRWVYGYYAYAAGGEHLILASGFCFGSDYNGIANDDYWIVCPETIGQYTGLKDMNGAEIYEGDIVEVLDPRFNDWFGPTEVRFSYNYVGGWILVTDEESCNLGTRADKVRILGNIHSKGAVQK